MKQRIFLCAGMLAFLGSAVSARADITFTFDSSNLTYQNGNQDTAIAHYMDTLLGGTCATLFNCVTVTGLQSNGTAGGSVATDKTWSGDGNVVSNTSGKSLTLGTSNGATSNSSVAPGASDVFLANTDDSGNQLSQGIEITFTAPVTLLGFDYEIFPDISCPQLSNCGAGQSNLPDLEFSVNGSLNTTFTGDAPCATIGGCQGQANSGKDGNSIHSPASGGGTELAPQLIGTWSGSISGVTKLDFLDWPATIGVDNIKIATATPEPTGGVFMVGGLFLIGFAGRKLRSVFAKS